MKTWSNDSLFALIHGHYKSALIEFGSLLQTINEPKENVVFAAQEEVLLFGQLKTHILKNCRRLNGHKPLYRFFASFRRVEDVDGSDRVLQSPHI